MHTIVKTGTNDFFRAIGPIGKICKEADMQDVDNGCTGGLKFRKAFRCLFPVSQALSPALALANM